MRIVGGKFKGRTLSAVPGLEVRPTKDRVRESIFNILLHSADGFSLDEKRVLDLFAGTGAMGLEAISRGARFCQFVEQSLDARAVIRKNCEMLGVLGQCKIWRRDANHIGPCAPQPPFDLIFADPPYGKGLGEQILKAIVEGGWQAPSSLIVLEEDAKTIVKPPDELEIVDERRYGGTLILFLRSRL